MIHKLSFWPNGHVSAFDAQGKSMEEFPATPWLQVYFDHLVSIGYDPEKIPVIEMFFYGGESVELKPFRTPYGWNYEFKRHAND